MSTVELEYCVPCGFRDRALDLQQAILTALERELSVFQLTMGDDGVFVVRVDDEVVYNKMEDEFDIDEIVRDIRNEL